MGSWILRPSGCDRRGAAHSRARLLTSPMVPQARRSALASRSPRSALRALLSLLVRDPTRLAQFVAAFFYPSLFPRFPRVERIVSAPQNSECGVVGLRLIKAVD